MHGVFGGGRSSFEDTEQQVRVGPCNAQNGLEDSCLVLAMPVMRVEGIVLQFGAYLRTLTVGKLHTGDVITGTWLWQW